MPILTSADTSTVEENASTDTVIYDVEANDPDNDNLTYSVSGTDASYFTVDSDDGEIRLLEPADYETKDSYTFDVTASDGELSDTKTVTVNVTDINEVENSNILFDEDNWQMDVIAANIDIHSMAGFVNADGSMTLFSEQTEYLASVGHRQIYSANSNLFTSDLDGNGLDDIILTDGSRVHAYYNLGDDNWQMDIVAQEINNWETGFINSDGSKTLFLDNPRFCLCFSLFICISI